MPAPHPRVKQEFHVTEQTTDSDAVETGTIETGTTATDAGETATASARPS